MNTSIKTAVGATALLFSLGAFAGTDSDNPWGAKPQDSSSTEMQSPGSASSGASTSQPMTSSDESGADRTQKYSFDTSESNATGGKANVNDQARTMFDKLDTDNNGLLSKSEFEQDEEKSMDFEEVDRDKNGAIHVTEYDAYYNSKS